MLIAILCAAAVAAPAALGLALGFGWSAAGVRRAPTATVELRGEDGAIRKVTLKHGPYYGDFQPTGDPVQIKEGNIGYLDLRHVPLAEIPAAIARLEKTRGLIVDIRGYPREGGFPLSAWLNVRGARISNYYLRAQVIAGVSVDGEQIEESMLRFPQSLPPTPGTTYAGKVAVLIDEHAMSQSEHTCLFLEVATPLTFIGAPTAGADGDVTTVNLPGGLNAWFSGQGVVHADGRPLQGIGIVPDIPVPVTFAGLRQGRDEPMEQALLLLRHGTQDK
jgi:C-terminal processing protease CtpA/Prc